MELEYAYNPSRNNDNSLGSPLSTTSGVFSPNSGNPFALNSPSYPPTPSSAISNTNSISKNIKNKSTSNGTTPTSANKSSVSITSRNSNGNLSFNLNIKGNDTENGSISTSNQAVADGRTAIYQLLR